MQYAYSQSQNLFYVREWERDYGDSWPQDCLDVSDEQFREFSVEQAPGKVCSPGIDGLPCWIDVPPPTQDELIAIAAAEKQRLIAAANEFMNGKQWPGKAAIGRLKSDELSQYNLWLDYLDALEAVDTSSAPDINWPIQPEV